MTDRSFLPRLVSLEIGRPLQVDDDDIDVAEPTPVDDEYIRPAGITMPPAGKPNANGLVAVIPLVRIIAQLKKTLKSPTVALATINTYDEHFKSIMATYPEPFPIHSQAYLDPRLLTAACGLQTLRFFLYRSNLSSAARQPERKDALERCSGAAKDTAHYVERSMQNAPGSSTPGYYSPTHMATWAARLRTMAPAFFCSHLWRCILVLALRLEFGPALTLVQASAAIGDLRKNNVACGRHLTFFLDKLVDRLRNGATVQSLEADEEMIAYASGDMQGSADEAWVWTGVDATWRSSGGIDSAVEVNAAGTSTSSDARPSAALTEQEIQEFRGWDHIQRTLQHLLHESRGAPAAAAAPTMAPSPYPAPSQAQYPGPPTPQQTAGQIQGSSASPAPGNSTNNGGGAAAASSSRISIKDIM